MKSAGSKFPGTLITSSSHSRGRQNWPTPNLTRICGILLSGLSISMRSDDGWPSFPTTDDTQKTENQDVQRRLPCRNGGWSHPLQALDRCVQRWEGFSGNTKDCWLIATSRVTLIDFCTHYISSEFDGGIGLATHSLLISRINTCIVFYT